ncbi:ribbon-helix-helix protein, CopG family [Faecalibacterium prausnitzii]
MQATVYIPDPLAEKMAARIDAEQCNRNELILQALREYLK